MTTSAIEDAPTAPTVQTEVKRAHAARIARNFILRVRFREWQRGRELYLAALHIQRGYLLAIQDDGSELAGQTAECVSRALLEQVREVNSLPSTHREQGSFPELRATLGHLERSLQDFIDALTAGDAENFFDLNELASEELCAELDARS